MLPFSFFWPVIHTGTHRPYAARASVFHSWPPKLGFSSSKSNAISIYHRPGKGRPPAPRGKNTRGDLSVSKHYLRGSTKLELPTGCATIGRAVGVVVVTCGVEVGPAGPALAPDTGALRLT